MIRFLDLAAIHRPMADELNRALADVVDSGYYIQGPQVEAFEQELRDHEGSAHAVGVGNGLDAITLVLRALGVGAGDEVVVAGHTFVATWLAVSQVGAIPVPVEPLATTANVDPEALAAAVTPRTAAIIVVHLYGQPAQMDAIGKVADAAGVPLIADGAQSIGASYHGSPVAHFAHATTLSFYPGKNLGALGDGGAVLTGDAQLAQRVRLLGNYGSRRKYEHEMAGQNSRLDELQAALLRIKLRRLDQWTARRRAIAAAYSEALRDTELAVPVVADGCDPVWHLYVVRHPARDALARHLRLRGVETLIHYPVAVHRQPAYADMGFDLPVCDLLAGTVLSLPMGPHLSDHDVSRVIDAAREFHG